MTLYFRITLVIRKYNQKLSLKRQDFALEMSHSMTER
jgi:hypothetical protein